MPNPGFQTSSSVSNITGYRYNYKLRTVNPDAYLSPLPYWLVTIAERLPTFTTIPDQAIINEYEPGQGNSSHIDCRPCFGTTIATISLGAPILMHFTKEEHKDDLLLEPRSLLTDEARHEWTHGIAARNTTRSTASRRPATAASPLPTARSSIRHQRRKPKERRLTRRWEKSRKRSMESRGVKELEQEEGVPVTHRNYMRLWSGRRGSNRRRPAWENGPCFVFNLIR